MANVSFDEEPARAASASQNRGLSGALVKTGLVANEGQANTLLLVLALILLVGAAYLFVSNQPSVHVPTAQELKTLEEMKRSGTGQ